MAGSAGKKYSCNVGDLGSISGLERSPREGKGYPLQYSALENSMDYTVHGVTESDTTERLSHFHILSKMKGKLKLQMTLAIIFNSFDQNFNFLPTLTKSFPQCTSLGCIC